MPINLYKGEASRNSEKKIGLELNLDQNPGLWSKISFYNSVDEDDYTDLIRLSENGKTVVGQGADTDTLVASAKAYINALNKLIVKREKTSPSKMSNIS